MFRKLFETIELGFWNVTIPLMTRSELLRKVVKFVYQSYHDQQLKKDLALSLAVSCGGFAVGMAVYSLTVLIA